MPHFACFFANFGFGLRVDLFEDLLVEGLGIRAALLEGLLSF